MTDICEIQGDFAVTENGYCAAYGICVAEQCPIRQLRGTAGMRTVEGDIVGAKMEWQGKVPFTGPDIAEKTGPFVTKLFSDKCAAVRRQIRN